MISKWFTTTFTVQRQVWSGDSSGLVQQGTFDGHKQQATDENLTEHLGLRFSKTWHIWCAVGTDVEEGDTITEGSNTYQVRFIQDRNVGSNDHWELIVEKTDG